ncbi:MAG: DNA repair protein RecO [Candidatus Pacebacteria bacterium]|nr:DNA repair protein RecO [Candidatus Paceibacterota bacterium]
MSTYRTQGIIIRRSNFGESSLILNVYTKDYGKIEAVARSARKPKGKLKGHLELFLLSDFIFAYGKSIDRIANSFSLENYENVKNNLNISFGAYYISELTDRVTENGYKNERMYYLFKETMDFLNSLCVDDALKYYLAIIQYQINVMQLSGFFPEINKCVICKEDITLEENAFSFSYGGVAGKKCVCNDDSAIDIDNDAIKIMRLLQIDKRDANIYRNNIKNNIKIISKLKVKKKTIFQLIRLMNKFIENNIERKINSVVFLRVV